MDLSIIIVNWNSRDYLRSCLDSILETTHGIEFELLIIDNASFDGCEEMLKQEYQQVRFIQSHNNLGFAKSNNEAFKMSNGRNLLFLNPDTVIEGNAINDLYYQLENLPDAGVVGGKLLNSDMTIQTSCIQAFPTVTNQVLNAEFLRRCFPNSRLWGNAPLFSSSEDPVKVDAISGACLMIRRDVFEKVHMFSTDYFMYSEDIDLCFKVMSENWKTYYIPCAVIIHHGGASSSRSSKNTFSYVMMLESRWRFFCKTRRYWYSWLYRASMMTASLVRVCVLAFFWTIFIGHVRPYSLESAMYKWLARLRWSLGGERWVKN